jgi:hypothetical protein
VRLITLSSKPESASKLAAVTLVGSTDIWAAGQTQGTDGALLSLTEHFNGRSWSIVPSLDPGSLAGSPDTIFDAISAGAAHVLFAVGTEETPTECCLLATAERATHG